jgi:hypothetical protein
MFVSIKKFMQLQHRCARVPNGTIRSGQAGSYTPDYVCDCVADVYEDQISAPRGNLTIFLLLPDTQIRV